MKKKVWASICGIIFFAKLQPVAIEPEASPRRSHDASCRVGDQGWGKIRQPIIQCHWSLARFMLVLSASPPNFWRWFLVKTSHFMVGMSKGISNNTSLLFLHRQWPWSVAGRSFITSVEARIYVWDTFVRPEIQAERHWHSAHRYGDDGPE